MRYIFKTMDLSLPLYIDSIGYDWLQPQIQRPQGYPYVHWLQTYSGSGVIKVADQEMLLTPGQGILLNRNVPHMYYPKTAQWRTGYFTFGGSLINEITATLGFHEFLYLRNPEPVIINFIQQHYDEIEESNDLNRYGSSELVYRFLLLLKKYMQISPVTRQAQAAIIKPITKLISTQYSKQLANSDFVNLTHYSTQYILKVFHAAMGISPHQLLMEVRIKKAKELLLNQPERSVESIGRQVGFQTDSHFISTFRRLEQVTPGKFRGFYR